MSFAEISSRALLQSFWAKRKQRPQAPPPSILELWEEMTATNRFGVSLEESARRSRWECLEAESWSPLNQGIVLFVSQKWPSLPIVVPSRRRPCCRRSWNETPRIWVLTGHSSNQRWLSGGLLCGSVVQSKALSLVKKASTFYQSLFSVEPNPCVAEETRRHCWFFFFLSSLIDFKIVLPSPLSLAPTVWSKNGVFVGFIQWRI